MQWHFFKWVWNAFHKYRVGDLDIIYSILCKHSIYVKRNWEYVINWHQTKYVSLKSNHILYILISEFRYDDNSALIYANWKKEEPNNPGLENCIDMVKIDWTVSIKDRQWNDKKCIDKLHYICEKVAKDKCCYILLPLYSIHFITIYNYTVF